MGIFCFYGINILFILYIIPTYPTEFLKKMVFQEPSYYLTPKILCFVISGRIGIFHEPERYPFNTD